MRTFIEAEKKHYLRRKKVLSTQKKSIICAEKKYYLRRKKALSTHFNAAFFGITFDTTNTSQIFELL